MSAISIFGGLVVPVFYMAASFMFGYSYAVDNVDVCKIQIERDKNAFLYERIIDEKIESSKRIKLVIPKETDEAR